MLHPSSIYFLPTLKEQIKEMNGEPIDNGMAKDITRAIFKETNSLFNIENFNENMLMWVLMIKLSKTPEGLKVLDHMSKGILDALGKGLSAYCRSGSANKVAAWGSGRLLSLLMERFGIITLAQAIDYSIGINIITGAQIAEGYIDTLQGIFPFTKPEPSEYPSEVHLGNDVTQVTYEEITYDEHKFNKNSK